MASTAKRSNKDDHTQPHSPHSLSALHEMTNQMAIEIKSQQLEQLQHKLNQKHFDKFQKHQKPPLISPSYNDIVALTDGRQGKIKFIGTLGFQSDTWLGLILSTPTGSHNGIVKHRKYWNCKPNHGTFIKRNQIADIKVQRIGERFSIDAKVKTPKGKGYIRFIGHTHAHTDTDTIDTYHENVEKDITDNESVMYGIELIDQMGDNSGSIAKQYYFNCAHYRGQFYTAKDLIWVAPDAPPTPRISRKHRRRAKKKHKPRQKGDGSQEIIGLDDNNDSIDLQSVIDIDSESDECSLSDSSSDDEFLTQNDMQRISLAANDKVDDRMSFARILHDFKNVQKTNVRSMTKQWETITTNRQSIGNEQMHNSQKQSDAALEAAELINERKRRRAGTLPQNRMISSSPIYQPPRFADSVINHSQKYKNRKARKDKTNALINETKSTPVSPNHNPVFYTSASTPKITGQAGYARPAAPARRRGKGKAGKKRKNSDRKKVYDEAGGSAMTVGDRSPSPMDLNNVIHEEPIDICTKSRSSIDEETKSNGYTMVSFSKIITTDTVSCMPQKHDRNGYISPGIISPGGGLPCLTLQCSHSVDHEQQDSVAVVDEIKSQNSTDMSHTQHKSKGNDSGGTGIPLPDAREILKQRSMSPTATNVVSWVFKPDSNGSAKKDVFRLKARPDSPFDIHSTQKDFQKVAEMLLLECNNPKNLFKVLKGVCSKLKQSDPRYRRIDTMNRAVQNKLLKFEGAEEFLQLLGFKQNNNINPTFWCCDMDQPPLSVIESAVHVCNDCLLKCNNKRATMDMLKKFSKHDLKNHNKKRRKKRSSRKKSKKSVLKREKSMDTLSENAEVSDIKKIETQTRHRNGSVNVDGTIDREDSTVKKPSNITISHLSPTNSFDIDAVDGSIEQESPYSVSDDKDIKDRMAIPTLNMRTPSIRIDDASEPLSNFDDIKFELELEGGDEDRFQLSDIIWSVTHKDNTDKDARGIILLCFPTFSNSDRLIKCLIERFFEPEINKYEDESSNRTISRQSSMSYSDGATEDSLPTHSPKSSTVSTMSTTAKFDIIGRIESLWEVQVKVVSFLQQWMRTYWLEDWEGNDRLFDIVEQFCIKIETCYRNDPNLSEKDVKKGMKLIKMIHQTMDFQEASLINKKKKGNYFLRQGTIPSKFERMTEMGSTIKKMRYDFVKLDNKRLAEQITLLDFKYFQAIQKRECLGQHWKKTNKYEVAPNICALIDQFNKMSKWVQATILLAKNVKTRGRLIKKFIKISNHLLALRNFQSLCAFHGALSSVPIHKLKHAWAYVPAKHIARFEEMRVIFNTRNNMGNLRKLHREAHAPLVPYTGIFLSDLVSIEEGNKKHRDDGTVNFSKLMRLANAIDNILLYQRTCFEIQEDIAVQSLLLEDFKMNAELDSDCIYKLSSELVRKDQPKKQKSVFNVFSK